MASALPAQVAVPAASAPVHLSLNFPGASVVHAEFGALSKDIVVAEVSACNETESAMTLPQSRLIQLLHGKGFEVLSRGAAIAAISTSQTQSKKYLLAKYSQFALNVVSGLVVSKAVSLGSTLGSALPGVEGIMEVVVPQLQGAVSDHAYLSFDGAALPAVLQLAPVECAIGTVLMSAPPKAAATDFIVAVPVMAAVK